MANRRLYMGVDVSTTGAKALLIDGEGRVVSSATTPLRLLTPRPLWSEQQPHEWWTGATTSIKGALEQAGVEGTAIAAIGLTGQMHGLVTLGERGEVLRPAILWNDQRTAAQCDEIRTRMGGKRRLVEITGNDALTGFTAPKILWVREHEPEVYARIHHILLPKDYLRYRLTGDFAMDKADGSGTLLFDLRNRTWSPEVLAALEIPPEWLPPTFEGTEITGRVSEAAAEATGLAVGTPVVAGSGDQAAGAVGVGAVRSGIVSLVLGTSGVVFAPTEAPLIEPEGRLHAFCHALLERWHLMGVTLSAAGSLQWYRDTLAAEVDFDELLAEAEGADAGSDGLLFLPYLSGERTPYPDPLARGAFVGLTLRHQRAHLTRALLEGVAFSLRDCFSLLQEAGLGGIEEVRVSGGGARSPLWRQVVASVLGVALVSVQADEGAAYGAALLAGVGVGEWPSVPAACEVGVRLGERVEPRSADIEVYARAYAEYRALYPALKPTFQRLSGSE